MTEAEALGAIALHQIALLPPALGQTKDRGARWMARSDALEIVEFGSTPLKAIEALMVAACFKPVRTDDWDFLD